MKKIVLLFALSTILCSCPTEVGDEVVYNYSVVNQTDKVIEIIPYQNPGNGLPELNKKITIQPGGKFDKTKIDVPVYTGLSFQRALYDGYLQKLDIVFDNNKKVSYEYCADLVCADPRNIFHITHNDENTEVYTITMADYQNAVDCGGNCY